MTALSAIKMPEADRLQFQHENDFPPKRMTAKAPLFGKGPALNSGFHNSSIR